MSAFFTEFPCYSVQDKNMEQMQLIQMKQK